MKKLIPIFLAICYCSTVVQANEYMDEAKELVESNKRYAPTLVKIKYVQDLFKETSYQAKLAEQIDANLSQLEKSSSHLEQIVKTIDKVSKKFDVNSYSTIIKKRYEYEQVLLPMINKINSILQNITELNSRSSFFEGLCERTVPMFNADNISLLPMNYQTGNKKVSIEDTMTIFGSLTLTGSIGVLLANGAILGSAATGIGFSLTTTAVASSLTGIGIVVGIATVISWGYYEYQQSQREKEYEYHQKMFKEAENWYRNKKITGQEYQAMANDFCHSEQWNKKFQDHKNQFQNMLAELSVYSKILLERRTDVSQTLANLKAAEIKYRKQLSTIIAKENLVQLRQDVEAELNVASAWDYYNRQIKPKSREFFKAYIRNKQNCVLLKKKQKNLTDYIQQMDLLNINNHKNTINRKQKDFSDIQKRSKSIIDDVNRKVQRCKPRNPEINVIEVQPRYVF
ncbi:hypothetical protein QUF74_03585 [Candidatus Halobeggiatoa sp. HSG11]|nr:hypothetical protein [Candidatus Halobeggiatoa sp. HSG11]